MKLEGKKLIVSVLLLLSLATSVYGADVKVIQVACRNDYQEIWDAVNEELAKDNIKVVNTAYDTTINLNDLLLAGDIDMNTGQHYSWLAHVKASHEKYKSLQAIGEIHIATLDLYSKKHKSLDTLPDGAVISIPGDPINGARALLVFATSGLIKLKDGAGDFPTTEDIVENPKKIVFKEIPSETMARTLEDVDAGFVYSINAVDAGMDPVKDPILRNSLDFERNKFQRNFVIVFTVRGEDADNPDYRKVIEAYHSDRVYKVYKDVYKNSLIPVFNGKAVDLGKY